MSFLQKPKEGTKEIVFAFFTAVLGVAVTLFVTPENQGTVLDFITNIAGMLILGRGATKGVFAWADAFKASTEAKANAVIEASKSPKP